MIGIVISFWYLNAKYLRYEKQYRKLYEWVVRERLNGNAEHLYRLDPNDFKDEVEKTGKLMIENTLRAFYIPIIIFMAISNKGENIISILII